MLMARTLAVSVAAIRRVVARHRKRQRSGYVDAPLFVSLLSILVALVLLLALSSSVSVTVRRDRITRGEPPSTPPLSPGGRELLKRCVESIQAAGLPRAYFRSWTRWELPRLSLPGSPASEFHGDLGWVETTGGGLHKAKAYTPTCFLVSVRDTRGQPFDKGCFQRASFMANMVSLALPLPGSSGSSGPKAPADLRSAHHPDSPCLTSLPREGI